MRERNTYPAAMNACSDFSALASIRNNLPAVNALGPTSHAREPGPQTAADSRQTSLRFILRKWKWINETTIELLQGCKKTIICVETNRHMDASPAFRRDERIAVAGNQRGGQKLSRKLCHD